MDCSMQKEVFYLFTQAIPGFILRYFVATLQEEGNYYLYARLDHSFRLLHWIFEA